jgi:hypothetical protein
MELNDGVVGQMPRPRDQDRHDPAHSQEGREHYPRPIRIRRILTAPHGNSMARFAELFIMVA